MTTERVETHPLKRSPAELAAARRLELAKDWLLANQVSDLIDPSANASPMLATSMRKMGLVLAAWAPEEGGYRYPTWQFSSSGQLVPQMAEILRLLREPGSMASAVRRTSGWEEVEWFLVPHVLLDDQRPAEVLKTAPDRVLKAAILQFVENDDKGGF